MLVNINQNMNKLLLIVLVIVVIILGTLSTKLSGAQTIVASSGDIQIVKATYDENGFSPKQIRVKSGRPIRLEVDAKVDGSGCMGSITIPGLTQDVQGFEKGKTNVFEVTPSSPGQYRITCAMGLPHGTIIVD
jgi:plastocyanin domain-containing protein